MVLSDISFVVIARNEEFAADKCLKSIVSLPLDDCEILCVDSGSEDKTLDVFRSYMSQGIPVRVFQIAGYSNAAIARNVGIREAKKSHIFFVDGDVELEEGFLPEAMRMFAQGYDAVTGNLAEIQYSGGWRAVERVRHLITPIREQRPLYAAGGIVFAKRQAVLQTGFYDERFERCQDLEYALRLTRKFRMIGLPAKMGVHHTIPYHDCGRIVESIRKNHFLYLGMTLVRNFDHPRGAFDLIRRILPGVFLGIALLSAFALAFAVSRPVFFALVPSVVILDCLYGALQKKPPGYRLILHYLVPFYLAAGMAVTLDPRRPYRVREVEGVPNENIDRQ